MLATLCSPQERELTVLAEAIRDPQRLPDRVPDCAARRARSSPFRERRTRDRGPWRPDLLRAYATADEVSGGSLLPPRFDVWDGATRVWWPGVSETSDPLEASAYL